MTLRSGNLIIAADKALPATTVREAHAGGLEARVRNLLSAGQQSGAFRSDLSADWLLATFHAVLHAAANEIDAGRLERAEASRVITATMLAALGYVPASDLSERIASGVSDQVECGQGATLNRFKTAIRPHFPIVWRR